MVNNKLLRQFERGSSMANNGWYSVYESEKPESGEEILTLSYTGEFPAPVDMFDAPQNRAYEICTYFYPGDQAWNEVPCDLLAGIPMTDEEIVFNEEGFYFLDAIGPRNASIWRRIKTIREGLPRGIVCWKRMDYPTMY